MPRPLGASMQTPPRIQKVLDQMKAEEIAAYIERRNESRPDALATLNTICTRFRMNHAEVIRIIENSDLLTLSEFAYKPAESKEWSKQLLAAWFPEFWPEAPSGRKLVMAHLTTLAHDGGTDTAKSDNSVSDSNSDKVTGSHRRV